MDEKDSGWSFMTGFLIGAIAGGIAGLVMAPKPGPETRANLMEQSETWRAKAGGAAANFKEMVGPAVDDFREKIAPIAEQLSARMAGAGVRRSTDDGGPVSDSAGTDTGPERKKNA